MTKKEFLKKVDETKYEDRTPYFYLGILKDHFLSENWYSIYWNNEDIYKELCYDIICNYPRKLSFKIRDLKKRLKLCLNILLNKK